MVTREEALAAIDSAKTAMADAIKLAEKAKAMSTEAGILTAGDIIGQGLAEARADAYSRLPTVSDYIGTQCSAEDVKSVEDAEKSVIESAQAAGTIVAMLVKAALKVAAAI